MYHLQIYVIVRTLALAPDPGTASTSPKEQLHIGIGNLEESYEKKLTIYLDVLILPTNHPFECLIQHTSPQNHFRKFP